MVCGMLTLFAFGQALPRLPLRLLDAPPAPAITGERGSSQTMFEETPETPQLKLPLTAPTPKNQRRPIDWNAVVTYIYGAIAFAFLGRFVAGMFLVRKLRATAIPISCTGADRRYESDRITVPVTIGWLRPRILLPLDWRDWSPNKLDAVLAHEGAHVRRHDGLIAALAHVNRCIFWFHPLAWMLETRLSMLAEQACDESSLATLGDRNRYAQFLLEMASVVDGSQGRMRYHALTMAAGSHIRRRIDLVLQEGRTFLLGLTWAGWTAVLLCGIPLVLCAGAVDLARLPPLAQIEIPRWSAPVPPLSEQPPRQPESARPPVMLAQAESTPPNPVAPVAAAPPAIPQSMQFSCSGAILCTFNLNFDDGYAHLANVTGAPYSGQIQHDSSQTLPNGTHMSTPSSGPMIYRDAKGRVRTERHAEPTANGRPAFPDDFVIAEIHDPVAGFEYVLDPVNRVAHRRTFKAESSWKWDPSPITNMRTQPYLVGPNQTAQFLGTRTIAGVLAYGQKTTWTRTTPDGEAITQTEEKWFDPASGQLLLNISGTSASANTTTMTMANYGNAEPDPGLFQVPEGYQTVDETGSFQVVHPHVGPGSSGAGMHGPQLTSSLLVKTGASDVTFDPGNAPATGALTGAPYSGHETMTSVVNDRPPHTGTLHGYFRDSWGRVRIDPAQINVRAQETGSTIPTLVEIEDPVAGYIYILAPASQTAYRVKAAFRSFEFQPNQNMVQQVSTRTAPNGSIITIESLGPETISGVTAIGQRTTNTNPPGTFNNNDKEIVQVNERWIDPKTGVVILTKNTGLMNTTISMPDYKEGDPDPSLFQIPAGYKIVDETGPFTFPVPARPDLSQ